MTTDPILRAEQARRLLDDPLLREVFAEVEASATAKWKQSQPHQAEQREDAYRMLRALDDLRASFQAIIDNGSVVRRRDERKS